MEDRFAHLARLASRAVGSIAGFCLALLGIAAWVWFGPRLHFSDTWQLVMNTGSGIVIFLVVFLIQNAQNRETRAIHLKADELIRATEGARNAVIDLARLNDDQLVVLKQEFDRLCRAEFPETPSECGKAARMIDHVADAK